MDALDTVSGLFTTVTEQVWSFVEAVGRAFANTEFPTMEELWADFTAGNWGKLVEKIKTTVITLMANLDSELHITATAKDLANKLVEAVTGLGNAISSVDFAAKAAEIGAGLTLARDNFYRTLTTAVEGIPWVTVGTTITTKINELTTAINGLTLEGIDWKATFETILVAPVKLAIAGITWLFSGTDFTNLLNAVNTAIQDIGWTGIAESLSGLGTAILAELEQLVVDIANDFGVELADVSPEGFSAAAQAWKSDMQAQLLIYAPDMSLAATIWATLFSNKLETTEPEFAPAAGKIGTDLVAAIQADTTDFSPAAVALEGSVRDQLSKTDYTLAGEAAGDAVANAIEFAFGAATVAGQILTSIETWANQLGLDMRQAVIDGMNGEGILAEWNAKMTTLDTNMREVISGFMTELQTRASEWVFDLPELAIPTPAWMTEFMAWADRTDATVNGWIDGFTAWTTSTDKTLNDWVTAAGAWADNTKKSFDVWLSAVETWQTNVQTTLNTWMSAAETWIALVDTNLTTWLNGVQTWADSLKTNLDAWLSGVEAWKALVIQGFNAWLSGVNAWIGLVGTTLEGWISSARSWVVTTSATLTTWLNRAIGWVASLLTAPPWVATLVSFAAAAPGWVADLFNWTPSWLADLFNFTIDLPTTDEDPPAEKPGFAFTQPRISQAPLPYYAASSGGATVSIGAVHIHNDMDVEVLAATIARRISQGGRR